MIVLPLNRRVTFKTSMRGFGRLKIPRVVRSQFKLEPTEVLKITVSPVDQIGVRESFLGKMRSDGYVTVPAVVMALLKKDKPSLDGCVLEVFVEPG